MSSRGFIAAVGWVIAAASATAPPTLDDAVDEPRFLRLLAELQLPEVLRQYLATHPPRDAAQAAHHQIAEERMLLLDRDLPPADRLASIERLLETRERLIEAQAGHPQRAMWRLDQASDLLAELWPIEATGITSLFGVPTPAQAARAQRVARDMQTHTAAARLELEEQLAALERRPAHADSPVLRAEHRRLAEERDGRLAFLHGVASVLHAELNPVPAAERRTLALHATDALGPLVETTDGALAVAARLYLGLARLALAEYESADEAFRGVAGDARADAAAVLMARLGGVRLRADQRGPAAGLQALDSVKARYADDSQPLFTLLLADTRYLLTRRLALQTSGDDRPRLQREALGAYLELLPEEGRSASQSWRAMIQARLIETATDDLPLDQAPPMVHVARAERLAREPATAGAGLAMFEVLLGQGRLDERSRGEALFGFGRALRSAGRPLEAAARFLELAGSLNTHPLAERAMRAALALAEAAARADPRDARATETLARAIDVMLALYPNLPEIDQWRFIAGRLALAEGRAADASQLFGQIPPDASLWPDARFMLVRAAEAAADGETGAAERHERRLALLAAVDLVRPILMDAARAATDPARRENLAFYRCSLDVIAARARLDLAEPAAALALLDGLEHEPGATGEVESEAIRLRIHAHRALGDASAAVREVERLLETAPDRVMSALAPMLASLVAEVERLAADGREAEASQHARLELEPLAERLRDWPPRAALERADRLRLDGALAAAFRLAGRCEAALPMSAELLRLAPDRIEFIFGRAECLFGGDAAQLAEAMGLYKRIAAAGPAGGGALYWESQLRMLQILDRVGRNTRQIAPRIDWLRQLDPALGGERLQRQFEALAAKHR